MTVTVCCSVLQCVAVWKEEAELGGEWWLCGVSLWGQCARCGNSSSVESGDFALFPCGEC